MITVKIIAMTTVKTIAMTRLSDHSDPVWCDVASHNASLTGPVDVTRELPLGYAEGLQVAPQLRLRRRRRRARRPQQNQQTTFTTSEVVLEGSHAATALFCHSGRCRNTSAYTETASSVCATVINRNVRTV